MFNLCNKSCDFVGPSIILTKFTPEQVDFLNIFLNLWMFCTTSVMQKSLFFEEDCNLKECRLLSFLFAAFSRFLMAPIHRESK